MTLEQRDASVATGASAVLLALCAGQFLMALDSSVMNVSIATVADDLGTTITGIQTAIVLYTLVMAMLMVTGGKIGSIIGRKRAFMIGLVIYCAGSLTTALAPNLAVLLFGWSLLEGIGAALIMPAIVALVAGNFPHGGRPRAYGLVGRRRGDRDRRRTADRRTRDDVRVMAVGVRRRGRRRGGHLAARPPHGRRAGRRAPPSRPARARCSGRSGMGLAVFGVLRSSEWGWLLPKRTGPSLLGLSPVFWLILGGLVVDPAVHAAHPAPRCRGRRAARHARRCSATGR